MTYFDDLHTYLHQSSLLIQAYPSSRITTKYSLPRKPKAKNESTDTKAQSEADTAEQQSRRLKKEPSATLTLKTYHQESGICLKYKTDKAAEVGRLMAGLGRLAKGEIISIPKEADVALEGGASVGQAGLLSGATADKMDVDSDASKDVVPKTAGQMIQAGNTGGVGSKKKKKSGKK